MLISPTVFFCSLLTRFYVAMSDCHLALYLLVSVWQLENSAAVSPSKWSVCLLLSVCFLLAYKAVVPPAFVYGGFCGVSKNVLDIPPLEWSCCKDVCASSIGSPPLRRFTRRHLRLSQLSVELINESRSHNWRLQSSIYSSMRRVSLAEFHRHNRSCFHGTHFWQQRHLWRWHITQVGRASPLFFTSHWLFVIYRV